MDNALYFQTHLIACKASIDGTSYENMDTFIMTNRRDRAFGVVVRKIGRALAVTFGSRQPVSLAALVPVLKASLLPHLFRITLELLDIGSARDSISSIYECSRLLSFESP